MEKQLFKTQLIATMDFPVTSSLHKPVLLKEAIELLDPKPGEFFIDGTLGGGGHAAAILERIDPNGTLLALDWDRRAVQRFREEGGRRKEERFIVVNGNFVQLPEILEREGLGKANGLLLDLGFSSDQMDASGRGFSFLRDEPLLMTYSEDAIPVKQLLKELTEDELRTVIRKYGEEKFAGRIARSIKTYLRKKDIETTGELVEIIRRAVEGHYERRLHPATRTFMALRIYANGELDNLQEVLENLSRILLPGGRVGIISFHSLEDRMVKKHFLEYEKVGILTRLTKKPIAPTREEVMANPRARSAKLRVAQLTSH